MSKVRYKNIHTGKEGEIDADKYEAFARRMNRGRGIIRKIGEVKPKAKTPPEAKKTDKSKTDKSGDDKK